MKAFKKHFHTFVLLVVVAMVSFGAAVLLKNSRTAADGVGIWQLAGPQQATPQAAPQKNSSGDAPAEQIAFSKRLAEAGVKSCLSKIDGLGTATMGGVANFFPASNWNVEAPDAHLASVFLGQNYANSKVPFGFAGLFAAPDGHGGCDGASVQVLASPLDCPTLQKTIQQRGKLIGDLAGVALLLDVGGQVALVPTAANSCVMVSIHIEYAAKP